MRRDIHTGGSLARAAVGTVVLFVTWRVGVNWWDIGAAAVIYPLLTVITVAVLARVVPGLGRRLGGAMGRADDAWSRPAALASVGVVLVVVGLGTALTFVSPVDGGSLYLFFGASMLFAAVMGYGGCEVLAMPNLLLRRRDEIWCWVYSPLDREERDLSRRAAGATRRARRPAP